MYLNDSWDKCLHFLRQVARRRALTKCESRRHHMVGLTNVDWKISAVLTRTPGMQDRGLLIDILSDSVWTNRCPSP